MHPTLENFFEKKIIIKNAFKYFNIFLIKLFNQKQENFYKTSSLAEKKLENLSTIHKRILYFPYFLLKFVQKIRHNALFSKADIKDPNTPPLPRCT